MAKLNDYYWKLDGEDRWFSWREVCEYRRGVRWAATTAKILVSEYHASQHSVEPTVSNVGDLPAVANQSESDLPA